MDYSKFAEAYRKHRPQADDAAVLNAFNRVGGGTPVDSTIQSINDFLSAPTRWVKGASDSMSGQDVADTLTGVAKDFQPYLADQMASAKLIAEEWLARKHGKAQKMNEADLSFLDRLNPFMADYTPTDAEIRANPDVAFARKVKEQATAERKGIAEQAIGDNPYRQDIFEVGSNLTQMFPSLVMSMVNPGIGLSMMGAGAGLQEYEPRRQAGETVGKAQLGAGTMGMFEGLTEKLPVEAALRLGPGIAQRIMETGITNAAQEALMAGIEGGYDKATISPDMTWDQFLSNVNRSAIMGGIVGPMMGGMMHPLVQGKQAVTNKLEDIQINREFDRATKGLAERQALHALDPNSYRGLNEEDLPAMLRAQEDGLRVDVGADAGIPAYLRPQAPEAPDVGLDPKYTENLPAMLREQAGAPAGIGMADRAPSVTDQQAGLSPETINAQMIAGVRKKMGAAVGDKTLNGLLDTGRVKIVSRADAEKIVSDLPPISGEKTDIQFSTSNKPLAFFNPTDGTSYFIADNINADATKEQLRGLALHEVGVHAAQLGQGDKAFKSILVQVDWMRQNGNKKMAEAYDRAVKAGTQDDALTHETLAYYVEANPNTSFSQKILTWFKSLIRKVYPSLKYSESELVQMATTAMKTASKAPVQTRDAQPLFSHATTDDPGAAGNQSSAIPQGAADAVIPPPKQPPLPEAAQRVQQRVIEQGGKQTAQERKRFVIPDKVVAQLAELTGVPGEILNQQIGDTMNAESLVNAANDIRSTWNTSQPYLKAIAEKYKAGTLTAHELAEASETVTRMATIGAQFWGVRGEAGRALRAFRQAQDAVAQARVMTEAIKGLGDESDLIDAINTIAAIDSPGQAAKASARLFEVTTADKLLEWGYMAYLSGLPTHVVNFVSNGVQAGVVEIDKAMQAAIGAIRLGADRVTAAELAARYGAYGKGTMLALKEAGRVFSQFEADDFIEYGNAKLDRMPKRAIAGTKGKVIRFPMRMLSTADALWKSFQYNITLAQEASRVSASTGIPEADLIANPTEEMSGNAWKQAQRATFTEEGGRIIKTLQTFRKNHPYVGFLLVPFVQTPGNIIKEALRHSFAAPALSEVRAEWSKGGRSRDMVLARMATGSAIMTTGFLMAAAGLITGQPPEDPNERRLWYMQNKQPYSVKMGDKWVSFSRIEPFGMLLGLAADFHDIGKRMTGPESERIWSILVSSIAKNLTSKTYLRSISDAVNAITEPERYAEKYLQRQVSGLVVPTGVAYAARAMDDRQRQVNDLGEALMSRLPYLRQQLPEKLDIKGDPIMEEGSALYRMISPAYLKTVKNDRVANELIKYDVSFPAASKKYRGVELSPKDHNELIVAMGKPTYLALQRIVSSRAYQGMPDVAKKYVLSTSIGKIREGTRKYWALQHPKIMIEAARLAQEKKYGR